MGYPGVEPGLGRALMESQVLFVVGEEDLLDGRMAEGYAGPTDYEGNEAPG